MRVRKDFFHTLSTSVNVYCNHLVYPAINLVGNEEKFIDPQQQMPEKLLHEIFTLYCVKSQSEDASVAADNYPSRQRQLELKKLTKNADEIILIWSDVFIRTLVKAIARNSLNATTVFQVKRYDAREIRRELRKAQSSRSSYTRFVPARDVILLDKLSTYQENLLNSITLGPAEAYDEEESVYALF